MIHKEKLKNITKMDNWDVDEWYGLLREMLNDLKTFVTQILNAKLVVLTNVFVQRKLHPQLLAKHSFEWQSLIKQACLVNNVPVIDVFEWTQQFNTVVIDNTNVTQSIRDKCSQTDGRGIHWLDNNFGRIITLQMLDHAFKICENNPSQC